MTLTELAPDSWPGVRILSMDKAAISPVGAFARFGKRFGNRLAQTAVDMVVRRGAALRTADREAFDRYLNTWRRRYERLDRPPMAVLAEAEAVRQGGPGLGAPPPPFASEWFAPKAGQANGYVFYVHGGSFIAERSPRITALIARFAAAAQAKVFAPAYRLAPEHPCPAAVEDIVAAYEWFRRVWPDEPVVALAESAGAAILVAALQAIKARGGDLPNGVLLLSPWVDLSLQSWSIVAASLAGTTPYSMTSLALMAQLYLQGRSPMDPIASPLYGDFDGFPPIMIHASRDDILYDDAVRLAERIRLARGDLTLRLWSGETHVWERMEGPASRQSIRLAADFIRRCIE